MQTTIDSGGRVVIPKAIRDRLHLVPGTRVDVVEHDGIVEIAPTPTDVEIVEGPFGAVLQPIGPVPPLTDEIVRETLDEIRRWPRSR